MSRNEDYLDNLLTSVTDKLNEFDDDFEQNRESLKESYQTQNDLPSKTQSALDEIRQENFIKEFENELHTSDSEDDFLREFEKELNKEADHLYDSPQVDHYVNQMEEIVDRSNETNGDDLTLNIDTMSQSDADLEELFRDDMQDGDLNAGLDSVLESTQEQVSDNFQSDSATEQNMGEDVFSQMANEQDKPMETPEGMEGLEDIFSDLFDGDSGTLLDELEGIPQTAVKESTKQEPEPVEPVLDERLEQILNESDDDALSEIGKMLDGGESEPAQQAPEDPLAMGPDFSYDEASIDSEKPVKKKKKEKNPNSIFGKLSHVLFGTPAELDPQAAAEYEAAKAAMGPQEEQDPKAIKEKKKQEKELKKQQKKEAAEQKKQEKEAAKAEKAAKKASKPKKEKKPKSKVPKEPPLPKVPVMMMWIMALSMMVLIFLGTSFVGYSSPVKQSKEAFEKGDYVTAYTKLQGIKLRKNDEELLHAASALAGIQTELEAFTALMEQKQYEMALDALVRGYGRCNIHSAEAEEWNVTEQLTTLEKTFDQLLKEQFDVSKRKARKLYKIKKRSEYTLALHEILEDLGLEE